MRRLLLILGLLTLWAHGQTTGPPLNLNIPPHGSAPWDTQPNGGVNANWAIINNAFATPSGTLDASAFTGTAWTDKLVSAYSSAACASGCTIIVPDSIAGNGAATTLNIPSNVTIQTPGSGNFTACVINLGLYSKWRNLGDALLTWSGSNCGMYGPSSQVPLQSNDSLIIDHARINCNGQTGANGIKIINGTAKWKLDTPDITGCTSPTSAALYLSGAQFGEILNPSLYNNYVGVKIYSIAGGGGNSNTFVNPKIVFSTVGVLISDAVGNLGQNANVFINPSILSSCAASFAIFGNSFQDSAMWVKGSPELNGNTGNGPACSTPLTIDSNVIQTQTSIYESNAKVVLESVDIEDTNTPWSSLNNGSILSAYNVQGYGGTGGQFSVTDATSSVRLDGGFDSTGIAQGMSTYPASITPGLVVKLIGAALYSPNPFVPNNYINNPSNIALTDCLGGTQSTVVDAIYGPVVTCAQAASSGTQDTNRWRIAAPFGAPSGSQDYLISFLIKCSTGASYEIGWYGDNNTQSQTMTCPTKWQRFVMLVGNKSSSYANTGLVGFPKDSSGPTIELTALEAVAYPAGTLQSSEYFGTILQSGAVNPNGIPSLKGITSQKSETGTADASVLVATPASLSSTYRVCTAVSVSSATAGIISWTLSWTDSNGNAQSNIAQSLFQQGTAAPATSFTTSAAGNYSGCTMIDVNNAGAAITVKWVGGGTTVAKMSVTIERMI